MKKIGLFYGINTIKTKQIAQKVKDAFGDVELELIAVDGVKEQDFMKFDNMIAGISTWFDGEMPTYWDEALPELAVCNFKGKKIAFFGLGDQIGYPDNFADGIGVLAGIFTGLGAKLVGRTSVEGYSYTSSLARDGNEFLGLILDLENQPEMTGDRIRQWVKQLKKEFEPD